MEFRPWFVRGGVVVVVFYVPTVPYYSTVTVVVHVQ